jgi:hypothetical protein
MSVEREGLGVRGLKRPAAGVKLGCGHVGYDWTGLGRLLHESCTMSALFDGVGGLPFMTHRNHGWVRAGLGRVG